jgi:hypothetical protein
MAVFWVVAPCKLVGVYQRSRGLCCLHHQGALMMGTVPASETSVNTYHSERRYNPEDSHLRTHSRENLKSYCFMTLNTHTHTHTATKRSSTVANKQLPLSLLMSRSLKTGQQHNIKIAHRDQHCMHEEITSRLNSENACCHSVQSFDFPPAV